MPAKLLVPDRPILFGQQGDYRTFAPFGFAEEPGADQTWSDGFVAGLQFLLSPARHRPLIRIEADPYVVPPALPRQDLSVYLNGRWIGFARAAETVALDCPFDNHYLSPRDNRLSFVMPDAARPHDLGQGPDLRRLGFAFRSVVFLDQP
jgi:hypothetical protein